MPNKAVGSPHHVPTTSVVLTRSKMEQLLENRRPFKGGIQRFLFFPFSLICTALQPQSHHGNATGWPCTQTEQTTNYTNSRLKGKGIYKAHQPQRYCRKHKNLGSPTVIFSFIDRFLSLDGNESKGFYRTHVFFPLQLEAMHFLT